MIVLISFISVAFYVSVLQPSLRKFLLYSVAILYVICIYLTAPVNSLLFYDLSKQMLCITQDHANRPSIDSEQYVKNFPCNAY